MKNPSFEWFYIDAHSDNGYDVVFTLHTLPFSSVFDITIWDLFVYKDNRLLFHHFFTRPKQQLKRQNHPLRLQTDDANFLRHTPDGVFLSLNDKDVRLELRLNAVLTGDSFTEYDILPQPSEDKFFKWILFAPYGRAQGHLRKGQVDIPLNGLGYHDYNAGNIILKKELKQWYWGKYYFNDRIVIFGEITDRRGETKRILIEADGGGRKQMSGVVKEEVSDGLILKTANRTLHYRIDRKTELDDIRFYTSAAANRRSFLPKLREVLAFLSISKRPFRPFISLFTNARYKRYRSEGLVNDRFPCRTFHEEMYF